MSRTTAVSVSDLADKSSPHKPALTDNSSTGITATFNGKDSPVAVVRILNAAAAIANTTLLDLRHIVVQNHLTVVIQLGLPSPSPQEALLYKALLSVAKTLQLTVDFDFFTPPPSLPTSSSTNRKDNDHDTQQFNHDHHENEHHENEHYDDDATWSINTMLNSSFHVPSSPSNYVLTLLSPTSITPIFLSRLAAALSQHSFTADSITRLSSAGLRCLELALSTKRTLTPRDITAIRKALFALGKTASVDVALQAESVLRRSKRLVVFDMDSTLIQQEVIDELARYAGVYEAVRDLTHEAMSGKLDFRQSLAARVQLLRGTDVSVFDDVIANLIYTPGAKTLCRTLKRLGYRLAVISGGFTRVTSHVRHQLGLDYDYANTLEEKNGKFTGKTIGPIVSAQRKADLLMAIAQRERITLDQVIAIGDGANDLPMLGTAGLGIAFNAKPAVQEAASFRINQTSLTNVLYLLGFSEKDQEELNGSTLERNGSADDEKD